MGMTKYIPHKNNKKGFSLIELVVVIIIIAILAVAVFAGGNAAIKKSKITRTKSDLHNFDIAIQNYMYYDRTPAALTNESALEDFVRIVTKLNNELPSGYTLNDADITNSGKISTQLDTKYIYKSEKKDPWGNPYFLLVDPTERNVGETEYFFTILSAGPNANAFVGGTVDKDDIFLLCQYTNGLVVGHTYNMAADKKDTAGKSLLAGTSALFKTDGTTQPTNFAYTPGAFTGQHINKITAQMFLTKEILNGIVGDDYPYTVINSNEPDTQGEGTKKFNDYAQANGLSLSALGATTWQIYAKDNETFLSEPAIYWSSLEIKEENLGQNVPVMGYRDGKYDVYLAPVVKYNTGKTNEYISIKNNFAKVVENPGSSSGNATFQFNSYEEAKLVYDALLVRYNENGTLTKNDMIDFGLE